MLWQTVQDFHFLLFFFVSLFYIYIEPSYKKKHNGDNVFNFPLLLTGAISIMIV